MKYQIDTNKYLQAFTNCPGVRRHGYAANFVAITMSRLLPFFSKEVLHSFGELMRIKESPYIYIYIYSHL